MTSPGTHIASIVHVTDTHLFVDDAGVTRAPEDRSRIVRWLARLGVQDLEYAGAGVVSRFEKVLEEAVAAERNILGERAPVIIVHTGDAEAFGATPGGRDFSGFARLDVLFAAAAPDGVVAVYGNHDVWPGSVALLGLNGPGQRTQKRAIACKVASVGSLPPEAAPRFVTARGVGITFVPLNSVNSSATRNGFLANGRLSPHPPGSRGVPQRVRDMRLEPTDLNIAVMHHPPHFSRPVTLRDRMGLGRLENARAVAAELHEAGINLVLAGHRHRLDPPFDEVLDAMNGDQAPLPPAVAQLVALSPTMETHEDAVELGRPGTPRRGLCVYRVCVNPSGTSVTMQRLIHDTDATMRVPTFEPAVICRIPLGSQTLKTDDWPSG